MYEIPDSILNRLKATNRASNIEKRKEFIEDVVEVMKQQPMGFAVAVSSILFPSERVKVLELLAQDDAGPNYVAKGIFTTVYGSHSSVSTEEKSEKEKELSSYKYISYGRGQFIRTLRSILAVADDYAPTSFIDVGCGIGDKLLLAKVACGFEKVYGIELNTHTIELARWWLKPLEGHRGFREDDLFPAGTFTLMQGDAFDYNYASHSFIYMYYPMQHLGMMERLWQHVIDTMPDNGWMIEVSGYGSKLFSQFTSKSHRDTDFQGQWIVHKVDGVPRIVDRNILIYDGKLQLLD